VYIFLPHATFGIMPQMKIEKKFCSLPAASRQQKNNRLTSEKLTKKEFQHFNKIFNEGAE
jgi:hypothetical protein